MNVREVKKIGSQLKRAFEGGAWHGPSLREILADVSSEQAAARPIEGAHSIWEIALHIGAWQNFVTQAVQGGAMPTDLIDEENWPTVNDASDEAWRRTRAELESGNKRLREALRGMTDADLERIVPGREYSFYFMLHGLVQHSLYHAGQAALLKRALVNNTGGE